MIYRLLKSKIFFISIFSLFCVVNANENYRLNFSKCIDFYLTTSKEFIDSNNGRKIQAIHIGDGQYLAYSSSVINNKNIIRQDTNMGLYLFKDNVLDKKYDLVGINKYAYTKQIIAINNSISIIGNITSAQKSFFNPAVFSDNVYENSVVSDICYQFYGLSNGGKGFIDKKYIDYFLNAKGIDGHSQIGLSSKDSKNGVVIESINPLLNLLLKNNLSIPFKKGDIVLKLNKREVESNFSFIDSIASIKPNTLITLEIMRNNKIFTIPLVTKQKLSKFNDTPSYLEFLGIYVDKDMIVKNDYPSFDFRQNDKILKINQNNVDSINTLNQAVLNAIDSNKILSILVLRKGFELFITIDLNKYN